MTVTNEDYLCKASGLWKKNNPVWCIDLSLVLRIVKQKHHRVIWDVIQICVFGVLVCFLVVWFTGGKKFLANSLLRFALTGCCGAAHGVTQHHSHSRWLLLPLTPPVTSRDPPGQGSVCENVFNFKVEKVNSVSVQLERASMIRAVVKAELQVIMGWIRSSLFLFYDML